MNVKDVIRTETFFHDEGDHGPSFWQVHQIPSGSGSSINLTQSRQKHSDHCEADVGNCLEHMYTRELVKNGSKPRIWFTGAPKRDPILMIYETEDGEVANTSIAIVQFEDWRKMRQGKVSQQLFIPKQYENKKVNHTITHYKQGNPSFEHVKFSGNIHTSKFKIVFEFEDEEYVTRIGKGKYTYTGSIHGVPQYSWKIYNMTKLNDLHEDLGYKEYFGQRAEFEFKDETYFLVEAKQLG